MQEVKLEILEADSLKELEKKINEYLKSDDVSDYKLLNSTVREFEEQRYPATEEKFTAFLTLVKN
ncbi:hypothetical protein [Staphylococcus kloosii]|jgi:hypothetical protein|uniref:Uncharacterized protein n=1 Tax=Staphylococcus kloosii TaxID=29384 RepID=A0A151A5B3_9STAP|nr:hypothetical protein [Staphylococcus kloosii]AVQ36314.1 hypothetical protein C7J89_09235 [Staphylococcus kloosii]KYH14614.1 hypothetical protein A0131_07480 [Staphylococcus kloosii]MBF7022213.1 hypothetical protein [Staphylococcus kloosii]MBF7029200.1 hypothetical protein [Staphylococcus kloosii]MCD8878511.1 hypothetical protein [Staphylococcus kloosii]